MPADTSSPSITPLSNTNYPQWSMEMKAWLMMKGLWMLVSGDETSPSTGQKSEVLDWKLRAQKAAGALFLAVEHEQRVHLGGIEDNPVKIWSKLKEVHVAQRPGA